MTHAVVIGGGVGGLAAAKRLAASGIDVTLCEAKASLGGLAQALDASAVRFDGGPYILLDPVGLGWAFEELGLDLDALALRKIEDVYEVERADAPPVHVYADLHRTADALEASYPEHGARYRRFVEKTTRIHEALAPLQVQGRPSPLQLVRQGAAWHAPFLLSPLARVLARAGLRGAVADALGIWTHVAGQSMHSAPSPLALVPAMIHGPGCYVPTRGLAAIPELLAEHMQHARITVRTDAHVARIQSERGHVTGVTLQSGEVITADLVISDASGVATLVELAETPPNVRDEAAALPLQSPGVAAYVLAEERAEGPYLRFRLEPDHPDAPCRLLVRPGALPNADPKGPWPVRIVAPLAHEVAERLGEAGQNALLGSILAEPWIQQRVGPFREVARLVPATWGKRHALWRDSMNPVMTARFMRQGRLPHRIATPEGLFLVGSSTHPGQWVSFCMISGVLGADEALRWLEHPH